MLKEWGQWVKDILGENNDIVESLSEVAKERLLSPFYGFFLVSWCVINWQLIYTAFFTDQDKIFTKTNFLRNEYLITLMPHDWFTWLTQFILLPFLLTALFFFVFPYISRPFFKRHLINKRKMRLIELQISQQEKKEEAKEKKEEAKLVEEETNLIENKVKKARQVRTAAKETPEVLWDKEFLDFKLSNRLYEKFGQIIKSVYSHSGLIESQYRGTYIDNDLLVFADTNELIHIKSNTVTLTPKGKYFVKKYSETENRVAPF